MANAGACPHQTSDPAPCWTAGETITIVGRDRDSGERFRPASLDEGWAQRVVGWAALVDGGVQRAVCCLRHTRLPDGTDAVQVHDSLRECAPAIYYAVLGFAEKNQLTVIRNPAMRSSPQMDAAVGAWTMD